MESPFRAYVCELMRREPDGSHDSTGYSLWLGWDGGYYCSCGSPAKYVASPNLYGCWDHSDHGCRNAVEIADFHRGQMALHALARQGLGFRRLVHE